MPLEIFTVGGYEEVGKNCTAIKVDDEVIIIDMGLHLPNYIRYTEEEGETVAKFTAKELKRAGAIPDDDFIRNLRKNVKAIFATHAHLDHIGAIPYLSNKYHCNIYAPAFACAVLRRISRDDKININNPIKPITPSSIIKISEKIQVEVINITHSIPHAVMYAVHTKYGTVLYTNDFKFDNTPVIGKKPDYEALERIGKKGVKVLIIDSLYAKEAIKTPSESVAKEMLRDVMLGVRSKGRAMIVTTFSSHLARLKSIVEFGNKLNREIIFLGRSLSKYISAGEETNLVKFSNQGMIVKHGKQVRKILKKVEKNPGQYLLVVTGHQGEPKAILSRMATGKLPFKFDPDDHVVFSCKVIPSEINRKYRDKLERQLKKHGVRIFKDIHVSGHAAREDLRDLINMTRPTHIIPAHAEKSKSEALASLAREMGYKNVHVIGNKHILRL
ncbi:RNase J family beta-CASP ribonuclease, partial [Candidatus Woesearchaeota archaeon]|nr:RNase J family beta-CASP ribonuclease [Candidatus Woesearchaeota archaeon]